MNNHKKPIHEQLLFWLRSFNFSRFVFDSFTFFMDCTRKNDSGPSCSKGMKKISLNILKHQYIKLPKTLSFYKIALSTEYS